MTHDVHSFSYFITIISRVWKLYALMAYLVYLGLKLSRTLIQSPHIAMISSRAFKMLRFIMLLSKDLKSAKSLKSLYCTLVRPVLELRIYNLGSLHCFWFWSTWMCLTKIFEIWLFCVRHFPFSSQLQKCI